jgi:hypothetical protein
MGKTPHQDCYPFPEWIFLDSFALQTIHAYDGFVWENEELSPADRIFRVPGGYEELEALSSIFFFNQRAPFEFALSEHSFAEIAAKGDDPYLQWAHDVLDHWEACLEDYASNAFTGIGSEMAARLDEPTFNYLSAMDRVLIRDAVALECDGFLTMERRLPRNAPHLRRETGLLLVRPTDMWVLLRPWAGLFT